MPVRGDIAVVIEDEPLTWNVLKLEVDSGTDRGKKGLEILEKLGLLAKNEEDR